MNVQVPDIGDFADVPVIEILVAAGDEVARPRTRSSSSSPTRRRWRSRRPRPARSRSCWSRSATRSPRAATILALAGGRTAPSPRRSPRSKTRPPNAAPPARRGRRPAPDAADARRRPASTCVVLGAGPGGYTAAFRAADLGLRRRARRALRAPRRRLPQRRLHPLQGAPARGQGHHRAPRTPRTQGIDLRRARDRPRRRARVQGRRRRQAHRRPRRAWPRRRKVRVVTGAARSRAPTRCRSATRPSRFEHASSPPARRRDAAGPRPTTRAIVDSTGALELADVPERLLVDRRRHHRAGDGDGLRRARLARSPSSRCSTSSSPGCDPDLVKPLHKRIAGRYEAIHLEHEGRGGRRAQGRGHSTATLRRPATRSFDRVLVAVGRRAQRQGPRARAAGVHVDERGFVPVDEQQRTNIPHIFAIGDVAGEPMLAHKAMHEAKVAAEVDRRRGRRLRRRGRSRRWPTPIPRSPGRG